MFYEKHFPYMKAYENKDGTLLYTIYYQDGQMVTFKEMTPCAEIINFCELNMAEYKYRQGQLSSCVQGCVKNHNLHLEFQEHLLCI